MNYLYCTHQQSPLKLPFKDKMDFMRFIEIKRDSILLSEIIMVNFDMINMIYSEKANGKLLKYLTYKILIINYLMYCLRKICILNICSSITNIYN